MTKGNTSFSKKLKDMGLVIAFDVYNEEDHPRDENGQWTSGESSAAASNHESEAAKHRTAASGTRDKLVSARHNAAAHAHESARAAHMRAIETQNEDDIKYARESTRFAGNKSMTANQRPNPAKQGSQAVKQDDYNRQRSLRATQKELPAVAAETAKQVPHAFIPAGNQKTPEHKLAVDPNRTTQKEMPAIKQPLSRQDRIQAAAESAGKWASRATTASAQRKRGSGK